jgi:hypothetical protein
VSGLLYWALRPVPILNVGYIPAAAVPLVRVASRRGLVAALAAGILAAAMGGGIAWMLTGKLSSAAAEGGLAVATAGACGLAAAFSRGRRPSGGFLALSVYGTAAIAALWILSPGTGPALQKDYTELSRTFLEKAKASGEEAQSLARLQTTLDSAGGVLTRFAPGILSAAWVLMAGIAFFLGRRLAREIHGFPDLRLPAPFAALFVAAGAASVVAAGAARTAAIDVLAPLLALYFLLGLSIITGFARRHFRSIWLRAGLYLMASWPPVAAATAGLGLFDWYFDFRKRAEKGEKET